jgi:hypothetical protein
VVVSSPSQNYFLPAFTPIWRFYVEANNLANQPLRYYQGISERTYQEEYYNKRINAGIKFDFLKK